MQNRGYRSTLNESFYTVQLFFFSLLHCIWKGNRIHKMTYERGTCSKSSPVFCRCLFEYLGKNRKKIAKNRFKSYNSTANFSVFKIRISSFRINTRQRGWTLRNKGKKIIFGTQSKARAGWPKRLRLVQATPSADCAVLDVQLCSTITLFCRGQTECLQGGVGYFSNERGFSVESSLQRISSKIWLWKRNDSSVVLYT